MIGDSSSSAHGRGKRPARSAGERRSGEIRDLVAMPRLAQADRQVLLPGGRDIAAGQEKPLPVLGRLARQPPGSRFRADEDEQPGHGHLEGFRLDLAAEPHGLEPAGPGQGRDLGGRPDDNAGWRPIRSMRYRDMVASSESRRMITCTAEHERARNKAACPAELPPPMTAGRLAGVADAAPERGRVCGPGPPDAGRGAVRSGVLCRLPVHPTASNRPRTAYDDR